MSARALWGAGHVLLALAVCGCPTTDDYFIEAERPLTSGGGPSAGAAQGGSATTGSAGAAHETVGAGGNTSPSGGAGCAGFMLPAQPAHSYLFCPGAEKHASAQAACQARKMRLVWLESAQENRDVAERVRALGGDAEAWLGASDAETEGQWHWEGPGGLPFWSGAESGQAVAGAFEAWADSTPNNDQQSSEVGEDCAVLMPAAATWGDRTCDAAYGYVCEKAE